MAPGTSPGKSIVLLAAAVALGCVALLVLFGRPPRSAPAPSSPESPAAAAATGADTSDVPAVSSNDAPGANVRGEPSPPPRAEAAAATPTPETEAVPEAESEPALLPSGIGLFPPPGTDPIKIGLVVPDDFELPEGFLRHYQVMDDGRDLPPILLFHPDYEVKGPDGKPIPLPADRVVPPELAPPGLPIVPLVVPEPLAEDGP